jgi:hypothetical protein
LIAAVTAAAAGRFEEILTARDGFGVRGMCSGACREHGRDHK